MDKNIIKVYTDGGSRNNPGQAAIGVVIGDRCYKKFIGIKTNNEAEYEAIIFALKKIKQLYGEKQAKDLIIEIFCDSELVVNQLNGKFKLKEENLKTLFLEVWNLKIDFYQVNFNLIRREENKKADKLVNEALDELLV